MYIILKFYQKNAMSQICPPSVCAHFLHYSLFTNKNVNRVNILSVHCTLFVCSCKNVIYLVPKSKSGTISLSSLRCCFSSSLCWKLQFSFLELYCVNIFPMIFPPCRGKCCIFHHHFFIFGW